MCDRPETSHADASGDDAIHLASDATAVRAARRHVDAVLRPRGWGEPDRFAAQLAVSELVTNAVVHAPGRIALRCRFDHGLYIEVTDDHAAATAHPRPHRPDRFGGMGLRLVDQLCRDWGVERRAGDKTVWCRLVPDAIWAGGEGAMSRSR